MLQIRLTGFLGRWLAVGLVGVSALGSTPARAEPIRGGALEWTVAAGGGAGVSGGDVETVTSVHLLPHLGYFVTGEVGDGWVRGNFEIIVEPTLIYVEASNSATMIGVGALARWVFATSSRVRPYLEAGGGVLGGQVDLRETNCDINFLLEGGAGAMIFMAEHVALTLGARFHHVSNGDRCSQNQGINSVIGIVGISYFFR
jgi:lipid A 3-O-deacylase